MQKREFRSLTVLGLYTGYLLEDKGFSDMHELAEFVVGHPVWTHEFGDQGFYTRVKEMLRSQLPVLEGVDDAAITPENFREWSIDAVAIVGTSLMVTKGDGQRTESPVESLRRVAPNAEPVTVQVPPPAAVN